MASANVELVRSIYAAWERGDWRSSDWAHPEIEYMLVGGPAPGRWTGRAGLAEAARAILPAFAEYRVEAEEYIDLDDERVLVFNRISGRGKRSGLDLGQTQAKTAHVFRVRDSQVTRLVAYWDRERALADLGLVREDDMPGP